MSDYQFNASGLVVRKSDGVTIPLDPGNADYRWYAASGEMPDAYVAPSPVPVPPTPRAWLERLSADKQAAIAAAGASNPAVLLWLLKAAGSSEIDVASQEMIDGVAALVTASVITADDQTVLLAP
jgi:hypothetical protein